MEPVTTEFIAMPESVRNANRRKSSFTFFSFPQFPNTLLKNNKTNDVKNNVYIKSAIIIRTLGLIFATDITNALRTFAVNTYIIGLPSPFRILSKAFFRSPFKRIPSI